MLAFENSLPLRYICHRPHVPPHMFGSRSSGGGPLLLRSLVRPRIPWYVTDDWRRRSHAIHFCLASLRKCPQRTQRFVQNGILGSESAFPGSKRSDTRWVSRIPSVCRLASLVNHSGRSTFAKYSSKFWKQGDVTQRKGIFAGHVIDKAQVRVPTINRCVS